MSVQFGQWNFDGFTPGLGRLHFASELLSPYAPDGFASFSGDGTTILYGALRVTRESLHESQPYVLPSGTVVTWDGRLDDRAEILASLGDCPVDAEDVRIAASAYERWGTDCFSKLIGDWALSIWNPREQSVTLAKDPLGIRHLYYSCTDTELSWSSLLDPLTKKRDGSLRLDEEYVAGWLSYFPAPHLTPYVGIRSVPPSCFVRIAKRDQTVRKYWDFDPGYRIRYCTDAEYEAHFLEAFSQAVRRRLRSDFPVLAELSGGMDSSSIVCVADRLIKRGEADTSRLDTVSYFDDSETNWNERPYFTEVEKQRKQTGCHIDVGTPERFIWAQDRDVASTPGGIGRKTDAARQLTACMTSRGNRVLLSGIGGDEVAGGVPNAIPELQDLLASGRFFKLFEQLTSWALHKRVPWFQLLFSAVRGFCPHSSFPSIEKGQTASWLSPQFVQRNQSALRGYCKRLRILGPRPSFQTSLATIELLRRQIASVPPCSSPPYEACYPYLDRHLLEFLLAIPREQLIRPGQRRSLVRRSLSGIVPEKVLNRKQKAFVARAPIAAISENWAHIDEITQNMVSSSMGVNPDRFLWSLNEARSGRQVSLVLLMRTLALELWLRNRVAE